MKVTVVKTGNWFVDRKLARLAGPEAKKVIRRASRKAIKPVQQQGRNNAKRNKEERSGTTEKSIKTRAMSRSRARVGAKVTIEDKSFEEKFYATFQELGWKSRGTRAKNEGRQDLKRAAHQKREQVLRDYRKQIGNEIKILAKK